MAKHLRVECVPLKEIGQACREQDVLLVVDAVASIGGVDVKTDEWCIDGLIGGTQKCLSVPSGMAPITFNERIESILKARKRSNAESRLKRTFSIPEAVIR